MENTITAISKTKVRYQKEGMKVPVVFHCSAKNLPSEETFDVLENVSTNENIYEHIAALSDVHPKKRIRNATGTAIASQTHVMPDFLDAAPNCGMRVIATDLNADELSEENIKILFKNLLQTIPTKKYFGTKIPYSLALDTFRFGSQALKEHFKFRTENEIEHTFLNGNFFSDSQNPTVREIRDVVPDLFIHAIKYRLGILGATGSHFLYLMKVSDVVNEKLAKSLNLKKDQYVFFMHTGSGIIGRYLGYMHSPQPRPLAHDLPIKLAEAFFQTQQKSVYTNIKNKLKHAKELNTRISYETDSLEGRMAIRMHNSAANQGFANRAVLTHNIDMTLEYVFNRQVKMDLVHDAPHVFIHREKTNGEDLWIHRNGATSARSGEPVLLAPFENTFGYIGVGTDKNESTFYSANHEIGKLKDLRPEVISENDELLPFAPKIFTKDKTRTVAPRATHANYADMVVEEMQKNDIMNLAVKLEPVAVLTY